MGSEDPGVLVLVTRLSKLIYRRTSEASLGMDFKQYVTLTYLREGGLPQQSLAETLHLDENTLVLLLNELEREELVARRRDPADRRRHVVEITPRGRRAVEKAERGMETVEEEMLSGLTASERVAFRRLLKQALEGAKAPSRS